MRINFKNIVINIYFSKENQATTFISYKLTGGAYTLIFITIILLAKSHTLFSRLCFLENNKTHTTITIAVDAVYMRK